MPIAIVVSGNGTIPAIIAENSGAQLVARLAGLASAPPGLQSEADARAWLANLDEPAGWFESVADASAHVARLRRPSEMVGEELRAIRDACDMSRAEFGAALGFQGNENTRHKQVFEMESGAKPIMPERARAARALAAEAALVEPAEG